MTRHSHESPCACQIVAACKSNGFTDMVIVHETRGEPDGFIVSHLPHGPTASFSLSNVVLRHDIENRVSAQLIVVICGGCHVVSCCVMFCFVVSCRVIRMGMVVLRTKPCAFFR